MLVYQRVNVSNMVELGSKTFKTRFSQKSEPEHLQKPKTHGKGRRSKVSKE